MSSTASVTSNSHYKFDVNATECVPTNFVCEDEYLKDRALRQKTVMQSASIRTMLGIVDEKYTTPVTGPGLDAMNDDKIQEVVMNHNVFAHAYPQNKIHIVKALWIR